MLIIYCPLWQPSLYLSFFSRIIHSIYFIAPPQSHIVLLFWDLHSLYLRYYLDLYLRSCSCPCWCLWYFILRHHSIFITLTLYFDLIILLFSVLTLKLMYPFIKVSSSEKCCLLCAFAGLWADRNMRELVGICYFKAGSASSALAFRIFPSFNRLFCIFISIFHNLTVILYILILMLIQLSYLCFFHANTEILFHPLL